MAVPSSGELRLIQDIALEVDGSASGSNISLNTLSSSAGFSSPNGMLEFYGYSSYTAPTVSTSNPTSVTVGSMTLNGAFTVVSGSPSLTQYGFYFGTNPNMLSNPRYSGASVSGNGFSLSRTGLSSSTTYYAWAFVVDSVQETVASVVARSTNAPFSPTWGPANTSSNTYFYNYAASGQQANVVKSYYNPDTSSYQTYWTGLMHWIRTDINLTDGKTQWYEWADFSGTNMTNYTTNTRNKVTQLMTANSNVPGRGGMFRMQLYSLYSNPGYPYYFGSRSASWFCDVNPSGISQEYFNVGAAQFYISLRPASGTSMNSFTTGQRLGIEVSFNYGSSPY